MKIRQRHILLIASLAMLAAPHLPRASIVEPLTLRLRARFRLGGAG